MQVQQICHLYSHTRRIEKSRIKLSNITQLINSEIYGAAVIWLLETSDANNLTRNTKYLAKTYLDVYLSRIPCTPSSLTYLSFCCFWIAVKYNQTRQVSESLSLDNLLSNISIDISKQQILDMEMKILLVLEFRMNVATPYDFMELFFTSLPDLIKIKNNVSDFIDLAITSLQSCTFSSEELFFGSLLAYFSQKKSKLSRIHQSNIHKLTNAWEEAREVEREIMKTLNQADEIMM